MTEIRLDNTRDPKQRRIMEEQQKLGICHLCRKDFETRHKAPIIHEEEFWFVTANNFPYEGSVHQYLIVPKRHIFKLSHFNVGESLEFPMVVKWLENHLGTDGYSLFVRCGDMAYTGATLSHLHYQFIVGAPKTSDDPNQRLLVTLGYKNNPAG